MVWIYGGGFVTGGAAAPGYSGEALAEQGIIFVSFNYRLGIFGFLSHPELTAESPHHSSGNYALMDQIAASELGEKKYPAFGGDPDHITIAGQSAGSASVNCLLASPLVPGLVPGRHRRKWFPGSGKSTASDEIIERCRKRRRT